MPIGYTITEDGGITCGSFTYYNRPITPTPYNEKASLEAFSHVNIGPMWIGLSRAAEVLGVSQAMVRRWIKQGVVSNHLRDHNGFAPEHSRARFALVSLVGGDPYQPMHFQQVLSMEELGQLVFGEKIHVLPLRKEQ